MGRVYLGLSRANRAVAIKIIHPYLANDPVFVASFRREVEFAKAVSGAYTAPVIASGLDDVPPWLATAYVEGPSLADAVTELGAALPEAAVWRLAGGLVEALQAVHACNLVHRDLKPLNVLLAFDGPKVIDFGISRALEAITTTIGRLEPIGTPAYMSPEQAQCKPVGPASDVFSLGSVIAFAATGRALFGGGLPVTEMYRVINDHPDLTSIAEPLRGVVGECLAKNPADRPSLDELLDAITTGSETFSAASPSSFWPRPLAAYIRARNDVTDPRRAVEELSAPVAQAPVKNEEPTTPPAPDDHRPGEPEAGLAEATTLAAEPIKLTQNQPTAESLAPRTSEAKPPPRVREPARTDPASGGSQRPAVSDGGSRKTSLRRLLIPASAGLAMAALIAGTILYSTLAGPGSRSSATKPSAPVFGGTLRLVAATGPDHIDSVPAYYTADYILERAYARQLLSYPTVPDRTLTSAGWKTDTTPVADIATGVPTVANGGITNGGMTYTFHIKPGVDWNTTPPRQVTAQDFIREFKAFCNPAPGGFVGNLPYYSTTIVGLAGYCNAETAYFANPKEHPVTAVNIVGFQNSHHISGIVAVNSSTLQFNLIQPASDFLYMLALPFASARPTEYDAYLPDSLRLDQHTISDGPYQISSYVPGKSITMVKNPAWKQSTDPVRHQYVNKITLTIGVTSAQTQLADMQAGPTGTYDMVDDTNVDPTAIPGLLADHDQKFRIWPYSFTLPYVVFNLRSPNANHAAGNLLVRQAVEYGLNKVAAQRAQGSPLVSKIIYTAIPPGSAGYRNYNLYPDKNGNGDSAKCHADLVKAGYKNGVSLTYLYDNDSINSRIFAAIQASLKPCGINLKGKPEPGSSFFVDLGNSPVNNKPGTWDLGQTGWIADWFGNNGRTIIQPLFNNGCVLNTTNYGCYHSATLNGLITKAEAATNLTQVAMFWHQADVNVMRNAVIVPLVDGQAPFYSSKRVHNNGSSAIIFAPNIGGPDVTNVWLDPATP